MISKAGKSAKNVKNKAGKWCNHCKSVHEPSSHCTNNNAGPSNTSLSALNKDGSKSSSINETKSAPCKNKQETGAKNQTIADKSANETNKNVAKTTNDSQSSVHLVAPLQKNTILVSVTGRKTQGLIERGASISVVSREFLRKTKICTDELQKSDIDHIVGVGSEKHEV